ncbi:MAG: hypothetical protein ABJB85_04590 [Nitrososphaerota archaeon]
MTGEVHYVQHTRYTGELYEFNVLNYDGPGQDDGMKVTRELEAVRELLRRTTAVL